MSRFVSRACATGLVAVAAISIGAAQQPVVRAFTDPGDGLRESRPFRFVIEIEGSGGQQVAPPRLTRLENLTVVGGPMTTSQHRWVNGQGSMSVQFAWTLLAEGPGPAEIPPQAVRIGSATVTTEAIRIQVGADAGARQPPGTPGSRPGVPASGEDVFLEGRLGTPRAWVGQAVPLDVTLLVGARERVGGIGWAQRAELDDFWVEAVEFDPDRDAERVRRGERDYNAYPVERKLLVPPGPGEFEIDPYVMQIEVQVPGRDVFSFPLRRTRTIARRTSPLTLEVRPLPTGAPDGFAGAVGNYRIKAALDRAEAAVNEAVALRVTVEGSGSLRSAGAPVWTPPSEVKVFEPKIVERYSTAGGQMASTKTWEWILVPLAPGDLRLPEIRFPYFDPRDGRYESAATEPLLVAVRRGEGGGETGLAQGGRQLQRRELAYVKPLRGELRGERVRLHERTAFFLFALLPLAVVPAFVVLGRRRARLQRDHGFARARNARAKARKRLRSIRKRMEQAEPAAFHEEVARTLVEFVADRVDRSAAGLSYDLADEMLTARKVDPGLRRRFRTCLETCDFARFVPASSRPERRAEVLDEATRVVEELDAAW